MKSAIITVAGMSTRFNEGYDKKELKCIYFQKEPEYTLLYRLVLQCQEYDQIVIVGGYLFPKLEYYVEKYIPLEVQKKICLIYNEKYQEYASGYSLYVGLKEVLKHSDLEEILFAEGDLAVDQESFRKIITEKKNVLTYQKEVIVANKSVAIYVDAQEKYHFLYNQEHGLLQIQEPFRCIYNSGQIWKFVSEKKIRECMNKYIPQEQDTNLVFIQKYFNALEQEDIEVIGMKSWLNCNTRRDYQLAEQIWREKDENT